MYRYREIYGYIKKEKIEYQSVMQSILLLTLV